MNPDGFTLAGQRKRCSILRCKMVCRYAVPSAFAFAVRAARDVITRPIPGARPTGQRKRCSKTLPAFLSGTARACAASLPRIRRSRPPQHSF
ncbi:hypothetical protein Dda3937_04368 [Dickeya dadantii 3937]|uniref:Uncharacterized protein n=1 Tax=Dickeya dadantii (strain 3937) TaxID=198628 RepID=E0SM89_DICD3|nr:hypothetical protein Dda3937_04368 [Dickeya dadantii 3937]